MSLDLIGWSILAFWIGFRLSRVVLSNRAAWVGAAAFAAIAMLPVVANLMVAMLAPIGVILPALAVRDIFGKAGRISERFHLAEVTIAFCLTTIFIAASIGVIAFDPYRYGFGVLAPALLSLVGVGWAIIRGHHVVALAILLAQGLWVTGLSGHNFFDYSLHALLVPVTLLWLVKHAVGAVRDESEVTL